MSGTASDSGTGKRPVLPINSRRKKRPLQKSIQRTHLPLVNGGTSTRSTPTDNSPAVPPYGSSKSSDTSSALWEDPSSGDDYSSDSEFDDLESDLEGMGGFASSFDSGKPPVAATAGVARTYRSPDAIFQDSSASELSFESENPKNGPAVSSFDATLDENEKRRKDNNNPNLSSSINGNDPNTNDSQGQRVVMKSNRDWNNRVKIISIVLAAIGAFVLTSGALAFVLYWFGDYNIFRQADKEGQKDGEIIHIPLQNDTRSVNDNEYSPPLPPNLVQFPAAPSEAASTETASPDFQ